MNLHLFDIPTSLWLVCASVFTVLAVILGYFYTHIKKSKQSKKIVAPSPRTPETKSTDADGEINYTVTDEAIEDATTEDFPKDDFEEKKWPTDGTDTAGDSTKPVQDPLTFCEHIQSEVKKAEHKYAVKKLQEDMTDEQIADERIIQQNQLAAIFKMMEDDSDKFGIGSMGDMKEQMKLYM